MTQAHKATCAHLCSAHVCLHTSACIAITASATHARAHTHSTWRNTHTKSSRGKLFSCCSSPSCPPPPPPLFCLPTSTHRPKSWAGRHLPPLVSWEALCLVTGVWLSSPSCPPPSATFLQSCLSCPVSPLLVTLLTLKWKLSFFPAFVSGGSSWGTPKNLGRGID